MSRFFAGCIHFFELAIKLIEGTSIGNVADSLEIGATARGVYPNLYKKILIFSPNIFTGTFSAWLDTKNLLTILPETQTLSHSDWDSIRKRISMLDQIWVLGFRCMFSIAPGRVCVAGFRPCLFITHAPWRISDLSGGMIRRTDNQLVGVGFMAPIIICMVSFSNISIKRVCLLSPHKKQQYFVEVYMSVPMQQFGECWRNENVSQLCGQKTTALPFTRRVKGSNPLYSKIQLP